MFDWINMKQSDLPNIEMLDDRVSKYLGSFQTKDLDNSLSTYKIENGMLYREDVKTVFEENTVEETSLGKRWNPPFIEKEISREWVKDDHTGTINVYNSVMDPEIGDTFWVEYQIVLVYGEMKDISLFEIRFDSGKEIQKQKEKWEKIWEKRDKDLLYRLCTFISRDIVSRLIHWLNKFDSWIRSYQPE